MKRLLNAIPSARRWGEVGVKLAGLLAFLAGLPTQGAGLTVSSLYSPGYSNVTLTLNGSDPNYLYDIQSSPRPGVVPFKELVSGATDQTVFTLAINPRTPTFFRAHGTNVFANHIPSGSFAGQARTPALGFNSWLGNGIGISENQAMAWADAMATNGMVTAGYKYLVLDQGWTGAGRNPDGTPMISTSFPHGMKYLADYIHAKGLKFGLYTCTPSNYHGLVGSGGYITQDAVLYSGWGVDYVKFDTDSRLDLEAFGNAFRATGRPLWYAPTYGYFQSWLPSETSSWRGIGGVNGLTDLVPVGVEYLGVYYSGWEIFLQHIDYLAKYAASVGPGHWNDPDAADTSWYPGGFAKPEMAMFSVLACNLLWDGIPLVQNIPADPLFYVTNSEVLAVHQDAAGIPGILVGTNASGFGQVWCRPLGSSNGPVKAVCFLNRSTNQPQTITINWSALGLTNGPALVRDLFQHANVGQFTNSYTVTLAPQDCQLVKITSGAPAFLHSGTNFLSDLGYLAGFTNNSSSLFLHVGEPWPAKDQANTFTPMIINGQNYAKGVGVYANAWLQYAVSGLAANFHAEIGVDDLANSSARVVFWVWLDGNLAYDSGILTHGSPLQIIDLGLEGVQVLTLQVQTAKAGGSTVWDVCDWGNACVICY